MRGGERAYLRSKRVEAGSVDSYARERECALCAPKLTGESKARTRALALGARRACLSCRRHQALLTPNIVVL